MDNGSASEGWGHKREGESSVELECEGRWIVGVIADLVADTFSQVLTDACRCHARCLSKTRSSLTSSTVILFSITRADGCQVQSGPQQ